ADRVGERREAVLEVGRRIARAMTCPGKPEHELNGGGRVEVELRALSVCRFSRARPDRIPTPPPSPSRAARAPPRREGACDRREREGDQVHEGETLHDDRGDPSDQEDDARRPPERPHGGEECRATDRPPEGLEAEPGGWELGEGDPDVAVTACGEREP